MGISEREQFRNRLAQHQCYRRQNERREVLEAWSEQMQIVGQQHRRNYGGEIGAGEGQRQQAIAMHQQTAEHRRSLVAGFALGAQLDVVGGDQGDFGRREESLHQQASEQRNYQNDYCHRWSVASSTAAPRTLSTVTLNSPSLSFSPARGTRPRRRRIKLLSVLPPP